MALTDRVEGMDIFELLRNTVESDRFRDDHPWTMTINEIQSPQKSAADDFLDTLLHDPSTSPGSPPWSPCITDSSINEDPLTDSSPSPHQVSCAASPAFDTLPFHQPPSSESQPPINERKSDVTIDLGWDSGDLHEELGITYYLSQDQSSLLPSSHALTVKDLLISSLEQKVRRIPQHSLQELVLNEDEKKLLAKEGVRLPNKLPLSKFEERILKKIRRKIRNKRSAQESRKKKREYVDSLEGRMSACSAHNLQLQRKIQDLEETNNALLEQLSRLQALIPNSSSRTISRGTCVLVLLLSFSLFISSSLHPDLYSQRSQAEYMQTKAPSRSLQSIGEEGGVPPRLVHSISRGFEALRSLAKNIEAWASTAALPSSLHQDHSHENDYWSHYRKKM
ncbi:cyclic AMP-responsive element-binding protein 3-like protein 3-A isoform X1 [Oryzias melastigma]|uniref:Cyclic AMP-responsive element-binding protein 3-like protein 3-A n=1 Tax=Oryzias melastigma TaxID=30732 RepID=A0A3B3DUT5_ORYME|nr:cyclic AMP-responsive element-binding protein 3-like protein 3-A isoform X1 [Oryzias melastigma]